jgi:hypothetical protein
VRNPIRLGDLSQKHPIRNGRRCLVYTLAGKKFSTSPQFCKQLFSDIINEIDANAPEALKWTSIACQIQ